MNANLAGFKVNMCYSNLVAPPDRHPGVISNKIATSKSSNMRITMKLVAVGCYPLHTFAVK